MTTLTSDLRYALRAFRRSPGFAVVAVLTLALGIGANTAIYTVVSGVLLEPLPYRDPQRIVAVQESNPEAGLPSFRISPANFKDFHDRNQVFESMAAIRGGSFNLTGDGEPERLRGVRVSGEYFRVLGADSQRGRVIGPGDDEPGSERVVLLNHGFWQRRFGGDHGILERTLTLNDQPHTVIGVLPADFPQNIDVYVPLAETYDPASRGRHFLSARARLKDGVTVEQARADLEAIAAGLAEAYPDTNTGWTALVDPLQELMVEDVRPALKILMASVSLVLLIACANVANLLLARMAARDRELAVRAALGAGRGRLLRLLLVESTVLALAGGFFGLLLAGLGTKLLVGLHAERIARSETIAVDLGVLAFTLVVSLAVGLVCGLLPALRASRPDLVAALKEGGRGHAGSRGAHRLRWVLVLGEVALALVLLVGAGLMLRSFARLMAVDPGFDPESALTARISLPRAKYRGVEEQTVFYQRLFERLASLPGVERAGAVAPMPLTGGGYMLTFLIEGRPPPPPNQQLITHVRVTSPGYFEAMGIRRRRGRVFTARDNSQAERVVVINETAAEQFWPGQDPLGQRLTFDDPPGDDPTWWTVAGVVGDVHHESLAAATDPETYQPFLQSPLRSATLVLRSAADPSSLAGALRREMQSLDPGLPVYGVRTLREIVDGSVAEPRFNATLLALFAILALTLAAIGVFGLISYSVSQRLGEIGVRLALGAPRVRIFAMLLRQGMAPVAAGIAVGLVAALAATRVLSRLVFEVSVTDLATFVTVPLVLAAVAAAACLAPALRATRIAPISVLREE